MSFIRKFEKVLNENFVEFMYGLNSNSSKLNISDFFGVQTKLALEVYNGAHKVFERNYERNANELAFVTKNFDEVSESVKDRLIQIFDENKDFICKNIQDVQTDAVATKILQDVLSIEVWREALYNLPSDPRFDNSYWLDWKSLEGKTIASVDAESASNVVTIYFKDGTKFVIDGIYTPVLGASIAYGNGDQVEYEPNTEAELN